ncbi:MAG: glycerophosphodiester phosphodiesterase family protein [Rhodospirillaceae bacterium]|nr:glycerophosphodiester phosphodiesterase family protein [Rhodospirillaceae bacterium]
MLPRVIGHRGAALDAPENTLAGLREAARQGCRWVEIDVRLTADHRLVLMHDPSVDRTTTATGRVRELPLARLTAMDAGTRFGAAFAGEPVPSLDDAIDAAHALDLRLDIELKCEAGDSSAAAAALVAVLGRAWRAQDPPLVSSFDHAALVAVRKAAPDLPVAVVTPTLADEWREAFETLGAAALHVGDRGLAADPVRQLTAEGIEIGVYTVNDGGRARDLFSWGVTGVFSDCPGAIAAAL